MLLRSVHQISPLIACLMAAIVAGGDAGDPPLEVCRLPSSSSGGLVKPLRMKGGRENPEGCVKGHSP
jgi:hypothetical protein